jgi:hypothetical protein
MMTLLIVSVRFVRHLSSPLLIRLRDRQVGRKLEEFLTENVYMVT